MTTGTPLNGIVPGGILLIDKPSGYTSFDVIAVLRGLLHEKRLGHTGTLDPMAMGVLPVLIGKATGASDILPIDEKTYRAGFVLGKSTDTQDITGTVLSESDKPVSEAEILGKLPQFRGVISQLPPMYSAVSVGGKRLYELARQGVSVERTPREITIFSLELEVYNEADRTGTLLVSCSKGTYIRTLINDLGDSLGVGGCMTALRRISAHGFGINDCIPLEDLRASENALEVASSRIIATDKLFGCYGELRLSEAQTRMYKNGVKLDAKRVRGAQEGEIFRIYGSEFLGLCRVTDGEIRIVKNFW
ncbi:MAG: tRNA pseudouridine(55) synthase TruB [Oscillospiraceae bacterium]|nr:tRNA pseudouridine(55) synthase TruB [Oscillospiraceae bacterium]